MRGFVKSDQEHMYALLAAKAKLEQQRRVLENKIEDLFLLIRALKYKHPHLKVDLPESYDALGMRNLSGEIVRR